MQAADIMTRKIITISPDHSVKHAACLMLEPYISGLPVSDDNGNLVGILSEGDLLRRAELLPTAWRGTGSMRGEDPEIFIKGHSWRIGDVMTPAVAEDTSIDRIAAVMTAHDIKRVPVVRAGGRVGIVSRSGIPQAIAAAVPDVVAAGDQAARCAAPGENQRGVPICCCRGGRRHGIRNRAMPTGGRIRDLQGGQTAKRAVNEVRHMIAFWSRGYRLFEMAVAAGLWASAITAVQARDLIVRVGHFPNVTHAQALVARNFERQDRNWFADRLGPKIRVEWYAYNAGPSAMEAIFAESIDLTYVGPNPAINAYARSAGKEIRIIAGAVNGGSALVVQPDVKLAMAADFRGKRIGTPQFGNTQDVAARAWLAAGGLRITQAGGDAQVVPTANPEQLSLFKSRQLDAVWTVEPWVSRLEMEAGGRILLEEKDAVTTVLVARAAYLSRHRDVVRRFVEAHRELSNWIKQHPQDAQRMIRDELKASFRVSMSPELIARAWTRMSVTSEISPSALEKFVARAQQVGFLRSMPELSRLIEVP